jgi:hypothetical protein
VIFQVFPGFDVDYLQTTDLAAAAAEICAPRTVSLALSGAAMASGGIRNIETPPDFMPGIAMSPE